ncbi:energy-coupling factor transporter transmembrane protein EcfT [Brevibacillus laterosporus]|uniref:energy-coupling factor transporter transmembrane component T family protein n=1 Tax=Brevibacillus laterosporus TaxID=1465 RepID=UPI000CE47B91|nr:energy-coupling factor transporter transmembrane protein EcfT [Brevibacillus laterosporus]PPA84794.1 energy-coupling factor transporter transmembrane protein EcfT [Brevibacillus laterosporus]
MLNKVMFGRYIDTNSWLHHLDPRSKLLGMFLFVLLIMLTHSLLACVVVFLVATGIMASSRITFSFFVKAVKPLRFLILFLFLFQLFFINEGHSLLSIGPFSFYSEGVRLACLTAWRMILLLSFTSLLTFTTKPLSLAKGVEGILQPFRFTGIAPEKLGLMISISLRFIPTIFEETQKITKAQASRGADLADLPWREKGKMLLSLLVPVTVSAFRRAEDLVYSMEARGYVLGAPRTPYETLKWKRNDSIFLGLLLAINILVGFILNDCGGLTYGSIF